MQAKKSGKKNTGLPLFLLLFSLLAGCRQDWQDGFRVLRTIKVPGRAVDVFYQDGRLYALLQQGEDVELRIFALTPPERAQERGIINLGRGSLIPNRFVEGGLFVRGNLAGAVFSQPGKLVLVDVSDPVNPRRLGEFETKDDVSDVWITPENVALVPDWSGICHVLDLKDPAWPVQIAEILPPEGVFVNGAIEEEEYASSVAIEGNLAFIVWWVHGRMLAFDVSDPARPKRLGEYRTVTDDSIRGWAYRALASGGRVYLSADQYSKKIGGIHIVDAADPAELKELGFFPAQGYGNPEPVPRKLTRNLALAGHHLFVSDHMYGIVCLDVSDPGKIKLTDQMELRDARGICAGNGLIFVAAGEKGILVLGPGHGE